MATELTPEMAAALDRYAMVHGRTWKQSLRDEWSRACTRMPLEQAGIFQQLRNASWFGLKGLAAYRVGSAEGGVRLAEVVPHAPPGRGVPGSYKSPDGRFILSCSVRRSYARGTDYTWSLRDTHRKDANGFSVEVEIHESSLTGARRALQRHLDELAAVEALCAGLEAHARNAGLVHEYRVTRPELYPAGSPGESPAGRQGYYVLARDEDGARRAAREQHADRIRPTERLDVQLWKVSVTR